MELDDAAIGLSEMLYLKRRNHQSFYDAVTSHSLGGHMMPMFSSIDPAEHIKVGCFYEIDHSKLPPRTPDQLNSIRIVMVNEKTRMRVSLRYPSIYTLKAYFDESQTTKRNAKKLPPFDEKCMMGSEIAAEALYRRITMEEISEKRKLWRFWVAPKIAAARESFLRSSPLASRSRSVFISKKVSLLSELKSDGMIKWGRRRQVRFLARHVEDKRAMILSSNSIKDDEEDNSMEVTSDEEEDEEEDVKVVDTSRDSREPSRKIKRKQPESTCRTMIKRKMPKRENKCQIVVSKQKKQKVVKTVNRWSAERYNLAEVNILKILKEKNAVHGNAILRPELRTEARKLIGDTGLLDHLLKHMAGKEAPGGELRFRRRHNAEGAMEYWLEDANLVDIRREAGVQDPYWVPPPGWESGDNPTQDPVISKEIKDLKEEMAKMKRDMEEMASKQNEKELAIVATPISSAASQQIDSERMLIPLKEMYIDLVNKTTKIEEQITEVSQSLCWLEEGIEKLKTTAEESNRKESFETATLLIGSKDSTPPAGTREERRTEVMIKQRKQSTLSGESRQDRCKEKGTKPQKTTKSPTLAEEKAAKIERLKSGFRICKTQGTFLWPDMTLSSPHQDSAVVPTPPSVSSKPTTPTNILSASPSHRHRPLPISTMKPLPQEKLVTVPSADITSSTHPLRETSQNHYENSGITVATSRSSTNKTPLINLNELPSNPIENGNFGSLSNNHTPSCPVTYHRRHQQIVAANTTTPCLIAAKTESSRWEEDDQKKEKMVYCKQRQGATHPPLCISGGSRDMVGSSYS